MNWQLPPLSQDAQQRLADILELFIKLGGVFGLAWAFALKVAKPYRAWRHTQLTGAIRLALEPELKVVATLSDGYEGMNAKLMLSLERQAAVFDEIDLFVLVVADLRDRADETNELLDASGLAVRDRRKNGERRRQADDALAQLQGKMRSRRRREDELRNLEERA